MEPKEADRLFKEANRLQAEAVFAESGAKLMSGLVETQLRVTYPEWDETVDDRNVYQTRITSGEMTPAEVFHKAVLFDRMPAALTDAKQEGRQEAIDEIAEKINAGGGGGPGGGEGEPKPKKPTPVEMDSKEAIRRMNLNTR